MSKKRPKPASEGLCKTEVEYWLTRVFKSAYSYGGQTRRVRNWAVKIQHRAQRKTFSLKSAERSDAAAEACQIYRSLLDGTLPGHTGRAGGLNRFGAGNRGKLSFWAQRLIQRAYTARFPGEAGPELSVPIDHAGMCYYFPLRTTEPELAAARALEIYRFVTAHGWTLAMHRFRREMTVAFHWLDSPLAWTYTTLLTQPEPVSHAEEKTAHKKFGVAIAESDTGVRHGLASCLDHMEQFRCCGAFSSAAEAVRELPRNRAQLVLANRNLADKPGSVLLEQLKTAAPRMPAMLYSVYEDSEQLFRTTPGGAPFYLLRRTAPTGFLDPLAERLARGEVRSDEIASAAWKYFRNSLASVPVGAGDSRLTNLTPREQEVLALLSQGYADKAIASRLGLSVYTVHEHVRNTFGKLGVHNRTEAVVRFLQK